MSRPGPASHCCLPHLPPEFVHALGEPGDGDSDGDGEGEDDLDEDQIGSNDHLVDCA